MSILETVVRRRELPDYRYFVEITTTGMSVTCRVLEDKGSFTITREIFQISKTKHRWFDTVELFYKVAKEHYPLPIEIKGNVNKGGNF